MEGFFDALLAPQGSWPQVGLAAVLAMTVALIAHWLAARVAVRAARRFPIGSVVLTHIRPAAGLLLPLLALNSVLAGASDALTGIGSARHFALLGLVAGVTWLGVRSIAGVQKAVIAAHPATTGDNLAARRIHTQTRVLAHSAEVLVIIVGVALMLTTFPNVRQIGASLLASAGLAGLIAGFAARPVLGNLIAGLQIGLTQPIRLDDVVIVEGEWGWIEEITGTYVVVKIWDQRRLVVPLQWWIEHPFQNWTRNSAELIGSVTLWVDYRMPIEPLREELQRICAASQDWDGRTAVLQVTEASEHALQLRALVSAADSGRAWNLRCQVRERLIALVQREYPECLPRMRAEIPAAGKA